MEGVTGGARAYYVAMRALALRACTVAALVIAGPARADVAAPAAAGSIDPAAWRAARRFMRALAERDARGLAAASALPLRVRYPARYVGGRVAGWAIDGSAADPRARARLLARLLARLPRADDADSDLAVLGREARAEGERLGDGRVRVRFAPDYDRLGDGTYDEIVLVVRRDGDGWRAADVTVEWREQR